ncbi:MAG TPA: membrane protein insertase YidC [Trebonia sp.]
MSILNPLYDAIAWVIMRIHAILSVPFGADSGLAWGLSIVLLVILLRLVMLPLFVKQVRAQQRMQQHMPQLQELRKKYKNDKQKLNEETMKYYKENGVNPLSGCLPLIAQFPVFISLFSVLRAIADWKKGQVPVYGLTVPVVTSALHAKIFGVPLAATFLHGNTPWHLRIIIFASVLISCATTYMTMRQSMKRGMMQQGPVDPDNPMAQSQKMMVYIAPFFALSGLYWAYGLVIYWVTNNLWTFGQQYFLFRNLPVVGSATVDAAVAPASAGRSATQSAKAAPARPAVRATTASRTGQGSKPAAGAAKAPQAAKATQSGKAAQPARATAPVKPSQGAKPGQPVKAAASAGKASALEGKAAPAGKVAAPEAQPEAVKAAAPVKAGAGSKVNGSSASSASSDHGGARGLLRLGKSKPEPEPVAPQKTTVRQQPVRQTRSKRSGKR